MILLIDNYDSFVHNLERYVRLFGLPTEVVRHDAPTLSQIRGRNPGAIVISPGPCAPQQAGISLEVVRQFARSIPILGICLGHQVIAEALGGRIVLSRQPMHGQTSLITHDGKAEFSTLDGPFQAARYHSLVVERASLPHELQITATTSDGTVMGLRGRRHSEEPEMSAPLVGWQFHPESILTSVGFELIRGFLREAHLLTDQVTPDFKRELPRGPRPPILKVPENVTF